MSNYGVMWKPIRPEFSIEYLRGTSTSRGYHESYYRVICERKLESDDFKCLDECGLLGMGQCYDIVKLEEFTEEIFPVTFNRLTGEFLPDIAPMNEYTGQLITNTSLRKYY